MPYITVKLLEGRSLARKELLAQKITQATCDALEVEPSSVRIEFVELSEGSFAIAGKMVTKASH